MCLPAQFQTKSRRTSSRCITIKGCRACSCGDRIRASACQRDSAGKAQPHI